jgi:cell division initiation protein
MRITPLDIRKQEFRKTMRGLDAEEVYAFLATVADEYESVLNDNKALKERLLELDDKVQEYRNMEQTLRNTLLTAERVNVEAKENARREADLIIKEAQIEAEKAFRNIKKEAMELRNTIQDLKRQKEQYLSRLRMLISSHLKFVETAEKDFAADDRVVNGLVDEAEKRARSIAAAHGDRVENVPADKSESVPPPPEVQPPGPEADTPHPKAEMPRTKVESPLHQGEAKPRHGEPPHAEAEAPRPRVDAMPSGTTGSAGTLNSGAEDAGGLPNLDEILEEMAETQKSALQADVNQRVNTAQREAPGTEPAPSSPEPAPAAPAPPVQAEPPVREERPVQAGATERKEQAGRTEDGSADSEEEWSLEKLKKDILSGGPSGNDGA